MRFPVDEDKSGGVLWRALWEVILWNTGRLHDERACLGSGSEPARCHQEVAGGHGTHKLHHSPGDCTSLVSYLCTSFGVPTSSAVIGRECTATGKGTGPMQQALCMTACTVLEMNFNGFLP